MGTQFDNEPTIRYIGISGEPCHPSNILWTDEPWRGRVLYTGPDGNCDYRVAVESEHRYVGIGKMSVEGTSEVDYLWRAAPGTPFARPKSARIGEVGWCVPEYQDWSYANTARQIMLGQFRQDVEDRHSHKYQNAWYPGPKDELVPGSDAARVMNVYKSRCKSSTPQSRGTRHERNSSTSSSTTDVKPGQRTRNYLNLD